jgi:hypothetical protein
MGFTWSIRWADVVTFSPLEDLLDPKQEHFGIHGEDDVHSPMSPKNLAGQTTEPAPTEPIFFQNQLFSYQLPVME